ncbi:MAG: aminoacyl-tRNA hydrolase [Desulfobacteraceae bacterium]|nr:aminoacyl-tRNA hydrolase [Desulfobacteraceae bacterium]
MNASKWLIAGLGNPGEKYRRTRHNVGFMAAERVADRCRILIDKKKFKNHFGTGLYGGGKIIVAKPRDYMNRSGPPLCRLADYFDVPLQNILVIHDDIDIEKGQVKIKEKGGHGGHNGVKSIIEAFGSGDFPRLRIGIGRPETPVEVTDYVLGGLRGEEEKILEAALGNAEDAVFTMIRYGPAEAMNRFNQKKVV